MRSTQTDDLLTGSQLAVLVAYPASGSTAWLSQLDPSFAQQLEQQAQVMKSSSPNPTPTPSPPLTQAKPMPSPEPVPLPKPVSSPAPIPLPKPTPSPKPMATAPGGKKLLTLGHKRKLLQSRDLPLGSVKGSGCRSYCYG